MVMRQEVLRLEKAAARNKRQLIVIIDESFTAGKYVALSIVSAEFEHLSAEELAALRAEHGEALLVVSVASA